MSDGLSDDDSIHDNTLSNIYVKDFYIDDESYLTRGYIAKTKRQKEGLINAYFNYIEKCGIMFLHVDDPRFKPFKTKKYKLMVLALKRTIKVKSSKHSKYGGIYHQDDGHLDAYQFRNSIYMFAQRKNNKRAGILIKAQIEELLNQKRTK